MFRIKKVFKNIFFLKNKNKKIFDLQKSIGYFFKNESLLQKAITHKSFNTKVSNNYEQLEFLGDAILDEIISDLLLKKFPNATEGYLTQKRSSLVRKSFLSKIGKKFSLIEYLRADNSLDLNDEKVIENQTANMFEAIIAAIKLDSGNAACYSFIKKTLWKNKNIAWESINYKGLLIEFCQSNEFGSPKFITSNTSGPDHEKTFNIIVKIGEKIKSTASGKTKKSAEQKASKKIMDQIKKSNIF
tara:strand:- start:52553 stop:53284 length:732 start_codon:yes stop_codon:yes gene_type:complete